MLRQQLLLVACGLLLATLSLTHGGPANRPVQAASAGYNLPSPSLAARSDVRSLFEAEAAHIRAQGFPLEPVTVDISDPLGWLERTVTCEPACGSRVLLLRSWYWSEEQARFAIAYGLSRVLVHDLGLAQDTLTDNTAPSDRGILFASCFGSEHARAFASRIYKPEGSCEQLAALLKRSS